MRSNSILAIWLTLIMLILVSAAAVFFLVQRNTKLETDLSAADREAEAAQAASAAASATRDRLSSDISVRQAALNSAAATRDTLVAEAELNASRVQELESTLALQASSLADARATLQAVALQVAIIAPADGAAILPLQPVEIMATVRADAGLDLVRLMVDDQQIAQLPADGQLTLNVRASWSPPEEGEYVIGVAALAIDGRSKTGEITVTAAFASEEARETALRGQLEEATLAQRFPTPEAPAEVQVAAESAVAETGNAALHRLLLTGRETSDEQAIVDEAFALQALGVISTELEYRAYLDAATRVDLVAYYDPESEETITYTPGSQIGAFGRWLGMHDLAHQWQAERLGLDELNVPAMDGDRRLATRALVEGDAVFLQYRLLADEIMPAEQADEARAGLAAIASDVAASLSPPMQATFEFAYGQGVPFVQALYEEDGFAAVNGAWRDLPLSSEQILHPERYLAGDQPARVTLVPLAASLGQGWRLLADDVFGEFLLRQHLARQPLTDEQIDLAASGWGGGRYVVYQASSSDIPVVVMRLAWDNPGDSIEFAEVYADYLALRYSDEVNTVINEGRCWQADGVGCLFQAGPDSLVVRAPDLDTALTIASLQLIVSQP